MSRQSSKFCNRTNALLCQARYSIKKKTMVKTAAAATTEKHHTTPKDNRCVVFGFQPVE